MSKGTNLVILIGNLGDDPEVRYMPSGSAVANLSVATGELKRDQKTGEKREHTEWHRVVLFGKQAEIAGQYLKKGSKVSLLGKNRTRKYQDKNKVERSITEVVGHDLTFLDSKSNNDSMVAGSAFVADTETDCLLEE